MPPLHRQYLQQARRLARLDPRRPQQGNLRRAVSTTYYALFHFLVDRSSRFFMGKGDEREPLRRLLARAYTHTEMMSVARTFHGGNVPAGVVRMVGASPVAPELRTLAGLFIQLQDLRHLADYDLVETFARNDVVDLIDLVEESIRNWAAIRREPATRVFLTSLLVWDKVRNK
jgi:hypothetical protein